METIEYTTSYPEQDLDLTCLYLNTQNFNQHEKEQYKTVRTRSELYLPTLYFPSVDPTQQSWARTLGAKTFVSWLELHTLVNHENGWNQDGQIELSLEYTMSLLGMVKSTFYRNVIHPLWNYGLIDLVESEYEKNGTKALNIIVYPYPLNDRGLAMQPLKQLRNYKTDYKSKSKHYGEKGAQIRYIQQQMDLDALAQNDPSIYTEDDCKDAVASNDNELLPDNQANDKNIESLEFSTPNSTVSFLQPKYSTTNIIYKTSDFRYLTIDKTNKMHNSFINESIKKLKELELSTPECLSTFVDYLINKGFCLEFVADLFDVLSIYCVSEEKLLKYMSITKFDIERGVNIINARFYIRKMYETEQFMN